MISCGNQWRFLLARISFLLPNCGNYLTVLCVLIFHTKESSAVIGFGIYWRCVDILNQEAKLTDVYVHQSASLVY